VQVEIWSIQLTLTCTTTLILINTLKSTADIILSNRPCRGTSDNEHHARFEYAHIRSIEQAGHTQAHKYSRELEVRRSMIYTVYREFNQYI